MPTPVSPATTRDRETRPSPDGSHQGSSRRGVFDRAPLPGGSDRRRCPQASGWQVVGDASGPQAGMDAWFDDSAWAGGDAWTRPHEPSREKLRNVMPETNPQPRDCSPRTALGECLCRRLRGPGRSVMRAVLRCRHCNLPPTSHPVHAGVVVPGGCATFLPALDRARLERYARGIGAADPEAYATEVAARYTGWAMPGLDDDHADTRRHDGVEAAACQPDLPS